MDSQPGGPHSTRVCDVSCTGEGADAPGQATAAPQLSSHKLACGQRGANRAASRGVLEVGARLNAPRGVVTVA